MRSRTKLALLFAGVVGAAVGAVLFLASGPDPLEDAKDLFWKRDYGRAARQFQRAVDRGDVAESTRALLARSLHLIKRYDKSARIYRALLARDSRNDEYARRLAEVLVDGGKRESTPYETGEAYGRERIESDPSDSIGHYAIGLAMSRRFDLAWNELRDELTRSYRGSNVWNIVHSIDWCLRNPNYSTARESIVRSLERDAGLSAKDPLFARVDSLHRMQQTALDHLTTARTSLACRGYAMLELANLNHLLIRRRPTEKLLRELIALPAAKVDDAAKVRAHRLLALSLERSAQGDETALRGAVFNWGSFLVGVDQLKMPLREISIARFEASDARGRIGVMMKDTTLITEVAEGMLKTDRNDTTGLFYRGMARALQNHSKEAKSDLLASLNRGNSPNSFQALMTLGEILTEQGGGLNLEQALSKYREAAKLKPNRIEPVVAIAKLHVREGRYRNAERRVLNALARPGWSRHVPDQLYDLRDRIEIALLDPTRNKPIADVPDAQRALTRNERDRTALHFLAKHWADKGDHAKARPLAERLVVLSKKHMVGHLLLTEILIELGDLDAAQRALRLAQEVNPADARPVKLDAEIAKRRGNLSRRQVLLRKAIQLDPRDWDGHFAIALMIAKTGQRLRSARHHLDLALELHASPPYEMRRLDLELNLHEGDFDDARELIEELCRGPNARPGDYEYFMGFVNEREKDIPTATTLYERGARAAPDRGDIAVRLADLYVEQRDTAAAFRLLYGFYGRGGRSAEVNARLIDFLLEAWKLEPALRLAREMQQLAPDDVRGFLHSGRAALHLDRAAMPELFNMLQPYMSGRLARRPNGKQETADLLCAAVYGFLTHQHWKLAVDRVRDLDTRMPGSPLRARALLAFFSQDHASTRTLVSAGLRAHPKAPFLRLLRAALDLRVGNLEGILENAAALVPQARPRAPWDDFATTVARRRPGFGRIILSIVGEWLLLNDELAAARELLQVAVTAYPTDGRLAYLMGHVERKSGALDEALTLLTRAEARGQAEAARDRAILLALRQDEDAIPILSAYSKLYANPGGMLLLWGQFEVGGAHWADALRALREDPHWQWDLTDTMFLTGLSYMIDGPDGARSQLPPRSSVSGAYLHGLLQQSTERNELQFVNLWKSLIRGIALSNLPLFRQQATQYIEDALAVDPEHPLFLDLLARQHLRNGDFQQAREVYAKLTTANGAGLRALGVARVLANEPPRWNEAVAAFTKVIGKFPETSIACVELAQLHVRRGSPRDAEVLLAAAQKHLKPPADPRIYSVRAEALEALGDKGTARDEFARALVQDPSQLEVANRLAQLLLEENRYYEALEIFHRMPSVRLRFRDLELRVGLKLFELKRRGDARPLLEKFPYSPEAARCLGIIHREDGRVNEAVEQFEFAFSLDPARQAESLFDVIEIHKRQLKFNDALNVAQRLAAFHPTSARAQRTQAGLMERLFQMDKALMANFNAWNLDKSDPRPLIRIIIISREKGNVELAGTILDSLAKDYDKWPDDVKQAIDRERMLLGK